MQVATFLDQQGDTFYIVKENSHCNNIHYTSVVYQMFITDENHGIFKYKQPVETTIPIIRMC